jgi:hypothetical protein
VYKTSNIQRTYIAAGKTTAAAAAAEHKQK